MSGEVATVGHEQSLLTLGATGIATVALAMNPTVSHMTTGKNIKDGTITSADIKDHSLRSNDFAVVPSQGAPGTPGATGAAGQNGSQGDKGDQGDPAPNPKVYKWTVHYRSDGTTTQPTITSTEKVPAGVQINPVSIDVGNLHNSDYYVSMYASLGNAGVASWYISGDDPHSPGQTYNVSGLTTAPTALNLQALAQDARSNNSVVGDFDAVLTFTETPIDTECHCIRCALTPGPVRS